MLNGEGGRKTALPSRSVSCSHERARAAGVKRVVFDRTGFRYHGRVRALAGAAREAGLEF